MNNETISNGTWINTNRGKEIKAPISGSLACPLYFPLEAIKTATLPLDIQYDIYLENYLANIHIKPNDKNDTDKKYKRDNLSQIVEFLYIFTQISF